MGLLLAEEDSHFTCSIKSRKPEYTGHVMRQQHDRILWARLGKKISRCSWMI